MFIELAKRFGQISFSSLSVR